MGEQEGQEGEGVGGRGREGAGGGGRGHEELGKIWWFKGPFERVEMGVGM